MKLYIILKYLFYSLHKSLGVSHHREPALRYSYRVYQLHIVCYGLMISSIDKMAIMF